MKSHDLEVLTAVR